MSTKSRTIHPQRGNIMRYGYGDPLLRVLRVDLFDNKSAHNGRDDLHLVHAIRFSDGSPAQFWVGTDVARRKGWIS